MKIFHLFALLKDVLFKTTRRKKSRKWGVIGHSVVIIILVLFSPVLANSQQDTLILLGINNDLSYARGVSANSEYIFVADWDSGISVIDYATAPTLPATIANYTENPVMDIEINRDLAYYVGMGRFYVRDISNPLQSNVIGWCTGYDWDNFGFRVHLSDTLAIVLHKTGYEATLLKIIGISDPTNPHELSTLSPPLWYHFLV